jgi:hypothetical protein
MLPYFIFSDINQPLLSSEIEQKTEQAKEAKKITVRRASSASVKGKKPKSVNLANKRLADENDILIETEY